MHPVYLFMTRVRLKNASKKRAVVMFKLPHLKIVVMDFATIAASMDFKVDSVNRLLHR